MANIMFTQIYAMNGVQIPFWKIFSIFPSFLLHQHISWVVVLAEFQMPQTIGRC